LDNIYSPDDLNYASACIKRKLPATDENSVPCGSILCGFYCILARLWGSIMIQINTNISEILFVPHNAYYVPVSLTNRFKLLRAIITVCFKILFLERVSWRGYQSL